MMPKADISVCRQCARFYQKQFVPDHFHYLCSNNENGADKIIAFGSKYEDVETVEIVYHIPGNCAFELEHIVKADEKNKNTG